MIQGLLSIILYFCSNSYIIDKAYYFNFFSQILQLQCFSTRNIIDQIYILSLSDSGCNSLTERFGIRIFLSLENSPVSSDFILPLVLTQKPGFMICLDCGQQACSEQQQSYFLVIEKLYEGIRLGFFLTLALVSGRLIFCSYSKQLRHEIICFIMHFAERHGTVLCSANLRLRVK